MAFLNLGSYLDEVHYRYSEKHQLIEMLTLGFLGFLIPFTVGAPQILVGLLVNALIIRSAMSLQSYRTLPVIFTPSIGAIAQGLVFGPATYYIAFMLPFIWAGNAVLVYAFKAKLKNKRNYLTTLLIGSGIKAGILFSCAFVLYSAGVIPSAILSAMGVMQFTTAVLGGLLVFIELKAERYFYL